ncbi:PAS domain S-box protein [Thalassoroseus pseudoceratinae]|uniref:PAS domain S-box protein n=1 Tax=Thalassoroseus pseudoceratinae TaxID=2713176 RepID=UPI0014213E39|nr:PAS domain S-box protein [Thalassoroseus pseudoceratinae]
MSKQSEPSDRLSALHTEVEKRFGVLPNFFRLAPDTPEVMENLWGFAKFGYLDNPLPSLFKERLFVYLSQFCKVRYCISRHVGFLIGLGRPSGDKESPQATIEETVRLIQRPVPKGEALVPHIEFCQTRETPLPEMPETGSFAEETIFACAAHVFLQTADASRCLEGLQRVLGSIKLQHLLVFITFVRTAHFWTQLHPELQQESDIDQLLSTQEALAQCVLHSPDEVDSKTTQALLDELVELRQERDQAELLRVTLGSIGDAVIATDSLGQITTLNDAAEKLTGWTSGDAHGKPLDKVFRIVHEETRVPVENPAIRVLQEGVVVGVKNHTILIAKDGTERFIDDNAAPIRNADGHIIGSVLVFRDVSERKRGEEGLRRLAAVVETSNDAIITKSLDGIIQTWNAAAENIFGYSAEEAVGSSITMLIPAERAGEEEHILGQIRAGKRVAHYDTVRQRKDGERVHVSLTISPLYDATGRVIGASKIARNVTDRKLAEAAAAEQARLTNLRADVSMALATGDDVQSVLQRCCEAFVEHLDMAFARIWNVNTDEEVLELQASAGMYTHLDGPHSRIGLGKYKIGRIAQNRQPHLTNDVLNDPQISDSTWAKRERMVGFAGYPLLVDGQSVGVLAMFSHQPISAEVLTDLDPLSHQVAQYIKRKQNEQRLRESEQRYRLIGQAANDAIWDWNLVTNQVVWNEGLQTRFGYLPDQVRDDITWWYEQIHPEDGERIVHDIHEAIDNGEELWQDEYRYRRADGSYASVFDRGRIVHDGNGKPVRMVGSMFDLTERKEAEERVRAQAELLRLTLSSIGDGVIATDVEGRVTFLNGAAQTLTGWTQSEAEGQPLTTVFHIINQTTRERVENPALRALREGHIVGLANHTVLIARDGTERNIDDSAAPIKGEAGAVTGAVLVFRDITEQYRSDEALRYQFRLTKTITDNATTAIFMMDNQSRCTFMNPAAERMTGFSFEEVDGQILHDLIHHTRPDGSHYPMPECPLDRALPEKFVVRAHEDLFFRKNGEAFPVECNARPINEGDEQIGTVIEVRDLTEEKAAAEKLQEVETRFEHLADAIPQLAWMAKPDGHLDWYNSRWYEYTGTTFEEMEGWGWQKVLAPENLPEVLELWQNSLDTGEPFDEVFPIRGSDGQFRPFLTRIVPFRDDNGKIVRWFGTNTDISEQKQIQKELRIIAAKLSEADRRKNEFLATLAHELRNPLAPIRTGLEALKLAEDDPKMRQEVRETMERQAEQMVHLIDDLLDVSRITQGKLKLRLRRVELADVMRSAVEATRPFIDEVGHDLSVNIPEQPVLLQADPTRLAQVLSNLLNNAAKYTIEKGQISLSAEPHEKDVVVAVKDTGLGIPAEMRERIFEMFGQIEHTTEGGYAGLGIGLTLVKTLVELHGGSIEVHSEGANQGSEFTVRLPRLLDTTAPKTDTKETSEKVEGKTCHRILVVDDNTAAATMLKMVVKMLGHDVRMAHDGQEAVEVAGKFLPDVVLMDLGMPKMNGYEAARYIREQPWGKKMMLVALTGWGQEEDKRQTKNAGFDHHLVKPAEPADLQQILSRLRKSSNQ